ncbi:MAG: glycosyltransferase family 2 protein [Bacilli bacterium]|nr:glycosyltransferase family 2 protein [Bacilli bacterium]
MRKKYTFLVPTWNRKDSIEKCLDSIFSQTIKDFEVIVLDDKSEDNTLEILEEKYKGKIKIIKHKKNMGISVSRNDLIKEVKTKYFTFVDSDDYIEDVLLEKCDKYLSNKNDLDLLCFCYKEKDIDGNFIRDVKKRESSVISGEELITMWIKDSSSFDTPVCYMYNTKFFKSNKFKYEKNRNHEDFALTPLILLKAEKVVSLSDVLYTVVLSKNSLVRPNRTEGLKKNIYDKLYHYDNLIKKISKMKIKKENKDYIYSFLANEILGDVNKLLGEDGKDFVRELKKREVHKFLLENTFFNKIKKYIISKNYKFYFLFGGK